MASELRDLRKSEYRQAEDTYQGMRRGPRPISPLRALVLEAVLHQGRDDHGQDFDFHGEFGTAADRPGPADSGRGEDSPRAVGGGRRADSRAGVS